MKKIAITTLKGLGWTLLGLFLALMLLLAAWLASNNRWVDDRVSDAVPPALQLPPVTLAPEQNGFYTLIGLTAPSGQDPNLDGQRHVAREAARVGLSVSELAAADAADKAAEEAPRLKWPSAAPGTPASAWNCHGDRNDCTARWLAQADALQALQRQHAELGARCEALADGGMALQEVLPRPATELKTTTDQYSARAIPAFQNWVHCGRWLRLSAVLAQGRGDTAALRLALKRSQAYSRGLLVNSGTLIANSISWRVATDHWRTATDLAARQPELAAELAQLLEPLPAQALDASRWMAHEAYFGRQVNREMGMACRPGGLPLDEASWWDRQLTCSQFGYMPRSTQQLFDQLWLQAIERSHAGPLALVGWTPGPAPGFRIGGIAWTNSIGNILVDVSRPGYETYGRRQADMVLSHQAAVLALKAAAHPPAERAAWLAAQPMDERLRERLRLDGDQLLVTPWSPVDGEPGQPIRYPLPAFQRT